MCTHKSQPHPDFDSVSKFIEENEIDIIVVDNLRVDKDLQYLQVMVQNITHSKIVCASFAFLGYCSHSRVVLP